jgi:hypothetical protein
MYVPPLSTNRPFTKKLRSDHLVGGGQTGRETRGGYVCMGCMENLRPAMGPAIPWADLHTG